MKILVEILEKVERENIDSWLVLKSKTLDFTELDKKEAFRKAKAKLIQVKDSLSNNQKIRILEYHNDEFDEVRKPCKILFKG